MAADHREKLINAGVETVHRYGFGTTGVRDIATAAGVPHGSFTNHFRSKESFGVIVLERYFERVDRIMRETLEDEELYPRARLQSYFRHVALLMEQGGWERGCMIPDLASEVPSHSEAIRLRLCDILLAQAERFERAIALVQDEQEDVASDLGSFILAAWHGTLLRMKAERNGESVARFQRVLDRLTQQSGSQRRN